MATTPPAEGDTGFSSRRAAPDLLAHTQPEPEPDASDGHPDIDLVALEADVALKKTLSAPHPKPKAGDGLGGSPPAGEDFSSCLDRHYVQQELRWARQYKKKLIVVFEKDERREGCFDFAKATPKYAGGEWEYVLNIDAVRSPQLMRVAAAPQLPQQPPPPPPPQQQLQPPPPPPPQQQQQQQQQPAATAAAARCCVSTPVLNR